MTFKNMVADAMQPAHNTAKARPWRKRIAIGGMSAGALLLALAGLPAKAQLLGLTSASPPITEYALPTPLEGPCEIEFDNYGNAWIEDITGNAITRFDPRTAAFKRFPLAQAASVPGGMEFGPDGALWFPQAVSNVITRLDPRDGSMQSFPIPAGMIAQGAVNIGIGLSSDISAGKDNGMWFSMSGLNAVGRIDVYTRQIEIIPMPTPVSTVNIATQIIKRGPGNTMLISLSAANKIATIDVFTREIKEYLIPTPASLPQGVTTDRRGDIWFTETAAHKFGRLQVATGVITEYDMLALRGQGEISVTLGNPLPFPGPIIEGSDGKIYIAEGGFVGGNKVAQFDPATKVFKEFTVPTPAAGICDLNNSRPGEIWFGELLGNKIGKLRLN